MKVNRMSIKDRLAKKTQDLIVPVKGGVNAMTPNPMRTGPGQMLMVNSLMKESNEKVALLEERLKRFEGGFPVLLLETADVFASKWANRAHQSFEHGSFLQLKADIAQVGGNIQPIKVRPAKDSPNQYEIIFGHRRHQACLELGLPILALVEDVTDAELFKQMDRENRARADLSPWEQGTMYRRALAEQLFSSREQLARELGIDAGNLSKALRLADLDPVVVQAFSSPLELQYRWAKPLADAVLHDRARVLSVVKDIALVAPGTLSPRAVFEKLIGALPRNLRVEHVKIGKRLMADIEFVDDQVTVRFVPRALTEKSIQKLKDFIASELAPAD